MKNLKSFLVLLVVLVVLVFFIDLYININTSKIENTSSKADVFYVIHRLEDYKKENQYIELGILKKYAVIADAEPKIKYSEGISNTRISHIVVYEDTNQRVKIALLNDRTEIVTTIVP